MKLKALIGFAAALSFANLSYADFTFHSNSNSCDLVSGNWAGSGKIKNWLIGVCEYDGAGAVSTVDNAGNFTLEVTADKRSGSFVCPEHNTTQLNGTCVNGVVTVKTDYGNLAGIFSETTGSAQGKLTVSPGVDVDVHIQFKRS